MKLFTVEEITSLVNGEQIGNCKTKIFAPEQIESAEIGNITFIGNAKYAHLWEASNASVAIVYDGIKISPEEGIESLTGFDEIIRFISEKQK